MLPVPGQQSLPSLLGCQLCVTSSIVLAGGEVWVEAAVSPLSSGPCTAWFCHCCSVGEATFAS